MDRWWRPMSPVHLSHLDCAHLGHVTECRVQRSLHLVRPAHAGGSEGGEQKWMSRRKQILVINPTCTSYFISQGTSFWNEAKELKCFMPTKGLISKTEKGESDRTVDSLRRSTHLWVHSSARREQRTSCQESEDLG